MAQSNYATVADIQANSLTPAAANRFGNTAMEKAILAASSIADSYIIAQFTLPLVVSPQGWDESLTLAVCNIASYYLFTQFGFNPNAPADKFIEDRYKMAINWLEQIRDKLIFPAWTDSSGSDSPAEVGPYVDSDPPVGFTNRGLLDSPNPNCGPWGDW